MVFISYVPYNVTTQKKKNQDPKYELLKYQWQQKIILDSITKYQICTSEEINI